MGNNYSVVFTHTAESDMDSIYSYITNKLYAESSAKKLMASIQEKIMRLKEFPFSCPVLTVIMPNKDYRKLNVDNYLVLYRVNEPDRQVIIARVFYASQNYIQIVK